MYAHMALFTQLALKNRKNQWMLHKNKYMAGTVMLHDDIMTTAGN